MIQKETEKKLDEYEELLITQKEAIEKLIKNLGSISKNHIIIPSLYILGIHLSLKKSTHNVLDGNACIDTS